MVWSSMASKWPIPNLLCWMDHQKPKILLIYGTFSVRGCWGQSMLLFWKLVDETELSKSQDRTDTFKNNLTSIFLSVRPKLLLTFQYEIPCRYLELIIKYTSSWLLSSKFHHQGHANIPSSLPTPKAWILPMPRISWGPFRKPPKSKASFAKSRLKPVLIAKKHLKSRN